jgi:hypothetical protein
MPIKFACPHCKNEVQVALGEEGKQGPCPHCRQRITVPVPRDHDPLPVITPSRIIRLHVTAAECILLDDRPVALSDLKPALEAAYTPGSIVLYSRDNPEQPSDFGVEVVRLAAILGLPIAFQPSDPKCTKTDATP